MLLLSVGCAAGLILAAIALRDTRKTRSDDGTSVEPTSIAYPAAPGAGPEQPVVLVRGDPDSLIVQRHELPTELVMAGGESKGPNEVSQVYFNPQAFLAADGAEPELLGVIANLTLFDDARAADDGFEAQGGLDTGSVLQHIRAATPGAVPRSVEPYRATVSGTDRLLSFRVHYELQGMGVYEYRYRVRVANAIGNLIMSARATAQGEEPAGLEQQARTIVERQVARLNAACQ